MLLERDKIKIGVGFLEQFLESHKGQRISIALDLETTGLQMFASDVTWLSWCSGEEYGAVPIRHRNHQSKVTHYPPIPRSRQERILRGIGLCNCQQGQAGKTIPTPHLLRNVCKNDDEARVRNVLRQIHYDPIRHLVIWHKSSFDLSLLVSMGWLEIDRIQAKIFDTLLASYNLDPVKVKEQGPGTHGLKFLHDTLLRESKTHAKQPAFESVCRGRSFQDVPLDEAAFYATFDAWSAFRLYVRFEQEISRDENVRNYFYNIECPHALTTVEIITSGMSILGRKDAERQNFETVEGIRLELEAAKVALFRLLGFSFNVDSPNALRGALFRRKIGIQPLGRGAKSRQFLTDRTTFSKILRLEGSEKNKLIIAHVMQIKRLTEVIKKHNEINRFLNDRTGRVHPSFSPTTATGRYSASKPNTLSLPGSSDLKEYFVPSPGNVLIVADFSQIDLRGIANETGEIDAKSKMLKDVNSGADLHLSTLKIVYPGVPQQWKRIYENPATKTLRIELTDGNSITPVGDELERVKFIKKRRSEIAKQVNFGIAYGLGAEGLLEGLNNPDEFDGKIFELFDKKMDAGEWQKLIQSSLPKKHTIDEVYAYLKKYHLAYPGIRSFQDAVEGDLRERGYTYNLFGKKCKVAVASHFDVAIFDIKIGPDKWFRARIRKLRIDSQFIYAELRQVNRLKVTEPSRKRRSNPKDLIRVEGHRIYEIDTDEFSKIIEAYRLFGDALKMKERLHELHYNSNYGANEFLSAVKPIPPEIQDPTSGKLALVSAIPSYPFVRIPHRNVKFVIVGEDLDLPYWGYDACRRELVSYRIQSTSMDFCKIAMAEFRRRIKERSKEWSARPKIINCVHDEIVVECHEKDCPEVTKILQESMQDKAVFEKFVRPSRKLLVEVKADVGSGFSYRKAKPK